MNTYISQIFHAYLTCDFFLGGGGWGVEESLDRWLKLIMLKVHHQSDSDILKNLSNQESDDDDDDDDVIIESEEEPIDSG